MRKSLPKRLLALILIITMVTTTAEWSQIAIMTRKIYASEKTENTKIECKEVIQSENTKTSTTFQLGNGKKETVFYGQDVRFETDNGTLKDYDPTLVKVEDSKSENGNSLKDSSSRRLITASTTATSASSMEDTPALPRYMLPFPP